MIPSFVIATVLLTLFFKIYSLILECCSFEIEPCERSISSRRLTDNFILDSLLLGILSHFDAYYRVEVNLNLTLKSGSVRFFVSNINVIYCYIKSGVLTGLKEGPKLFIIGDRLQLDFKQIKEVWEGAATAAKEHGYSKVDLDLVPSPNGLTISVSVCGETSLLMAKRRPEAKSMDLICVSDNLGAAYMGFQVLEREKKAFMQSGDVKAQPKLDDYKHLVGAYLKPQINPQTVKQLEDSEIMPSYGYLVNRGLADAVRRLVRDSGMGAKVYIDKLPFAGKTFDLGKEMNIDPMSAALNGGEDYRLLFTIPIGKHDKFRHDFQTFDIIGHLAKPEVGAVVVTPDGVELPMKAQGWNNE